MLNVGKGGTKIRKE